MKNVFKISVKTVCSIFLFVIFNGQAQEATSTDNTAKTYAIAGTVLEDDSFPLEGVNIILKDSKEGVVTNENGKFKFTRKLALGDVLVFSFIGFQPQEYVISADDMANQNIAISFDSSNITLMGALEVDGVYHSKRNIFQKFVGLFK